MTDLTPDAHKFIVENQHIKNPLLADLVLRKYGISYSRQHIGRLKARPLEQNIVQKSSRKVREKNNGTGFRLTYHGFLQLCKNHPNHSFSKYFLERNQPPKYPGRAELMKVLQLLEDCYKI